MATAPVARAEADESQAFAITIDFAKGKGDPTRPFRTMVALTESLARLDRDLVRSIDLAIEPVLLLEDVKTGSIQSWFVSMVRSLNDSALRSGDWKKIVGEYVADGRLAFLKRVEKAKSVTDPQLLDNLQAELLELAEQTDARSIPGYVPLSKAQIAGHIADVTSSLEYLDEEDKATYQQRGSASVAFNPNVRVDDAEIAALLTQRTVTNESELILKVKKPDFLGSSMWEFRFDGRTIEAKILDASWLHRFQAGEARVLPGAALRALVRVEVGYDEQNEALPAKYTVLRVHEVLPPSSRTASNQAQLTLPQGDDPAS